MRPKVQFPAIFILIFILQITLGTTPIQAASTSQSYIIVFRTR